MALAITATYNGSSSSPGVDLEISGALGFEKILVERIDNTGTYSTVAVRSLDRATVQNDDIFETDFEAPIGLSLSYRATALNFDPGITYTGTGIESAGTTSATPAYPSGGSSDTLNIMAVVMKPYTSTLSTPSGWTLVGSKTSGTTASGVDTGSTIVYTFQRTGGFTGTETLSPSGSNVIVASISTFQKTVSAAWEVNAVSGADESAGVGHSSTATSSLDLSNKDMLLVAAGYNTDTVSGGAENMTLTATNASFGNIAMAMLHPSSLGNDATLEVAYARVAFASAPATPTYARTSLAGVDLFGATMFLQVTISGTSQDSDTTGNVTLPYTHTSQAWLKSVFTPLLSREVHVQEMPDVSYETQILGEYNVLGRVNPVIITDTWGSRTGSISFLTGRSDLGTFRELKELITTGGTLMFQTTGDLANEIPDLYFEVDSYKVSRKDKPGGEALPLYEHTISYSEVDRPDTSDASLALRSYQDVLDEFATYQAVVDSHATYLSLLTG